ncbi:MULTISPECIES: GlxA family transcriptional regulator [Paracoccaceae]|jgi:transcriptional regulator GlxA family with amidase domain|uniref:GlxA family transcriptional regulator n=1 Tax=Paracoccaceae TaxID=31989 RepID=UPI00303F0F0F
MTDQFHQFDLDTLLPQKPRREGCAPGHNLSVAAFVADGFSLLSLASISEALALANGATRARQCRIETLGFTSHNVTSRSGTIIRTDRVLPEGLQDFSLVTLFDLVVLCVGPELDKETSTLVHRLIRICKRSRIPVCLIGGSIREAARQGLLSRCSTHWTQVWALRESEPGIEVSDTIFTRDGQVVTCPGELAALDFTIELMKSRFGAEIAGHVAANLLVDTVRSGDRRQPGSARDRYRGIPAVLSEVIALIEESLEDQPSMSAIAAKVGLSVRQVERYFVRFLGTSPVRFRRVLQMDHAMRLLERTEMSILEVSIACGFSAASTFNKHFRKVYGLTPSMWRLSGFMRGGREDSKGGYGRPAPMSPAVVAGIS